MRLDITNYRLDHFTPEQLWDIGHGLAAKYKGEVLGGHMVAIDVNDDATDAQFERIVAGFVTYLGDVMGLTNAEIRKVML